MDGAFVSRGQNGHDDEIRRPLQMPKKVRVVGQASNQLWNPQRSKPRRRPCPGVRDAKSQRPCGSMAESGCEALLRLCHSPPFAHTSQWSFEKAIAVFRDGANEETLKCGEAPLPERDWPRACCGGVHCGLLQHL